MLCTPACQETPWWLRYLHLGLRGYDGEGNWLLPVLYVRVECYIFYILWLDQRTIHNLQASIFLIDYKPLHHGGPRLVGPLQSASSLTSDGRVKGGQLDNVGDIIDFVHLQDE